MLDVLDLAQVSSKITTEEASNSFPSSEEDFYSSDESSDYEKVPEDVNDNDFIGNASCDKVELKKKVGRPSSSFVSFNDQIMFSQSGILFSDVMEMISAFTIAYGLTSRARIHLTNMIQICAGEEFQYMKISNHTIDKISEPPADKIIYNFYCETCKQSILNSSSKKGINNQKKVCSHCGEESIISLSNKHLFVTVDLEYKIKLMLQHKEFRDNLNNNKIESNCENVIKDIHDAKLYKDCKKLFPDTITYIISTDGAPLHHCSKKGFCLFRLLLLISLLI